jgi:hypothetical protein
MELSVPVALFPGRVVGRYSIVAQSYRKRFRIDLAWPCFDAYNCPCKAVRNGSWSNESSVDVPAFATVESLSPWSLSGSLLYCDLYLEMLCPVQLLQLSV